MSDTNHCQKCQGNISEVATKCPHCGFEPRKDGHTARQIRVVVGLILTFSVIGAILGIPMLIAAYYQGHKAKKRTPTNYNPA